MWAWASPDSVSAALTLAAAEDGLIVAAGEALAAQLEAAGIPMHVDARRWTVGDVLKRPGVLAVLSRDVFVFQSPAKAQFLGDYATFSRAASLAFDSEPDAQRALLASRDHISTRTPLGVALGWGAENEFVSSTTTRMQSTCTPPTIASTSRRSATLAPRPDRCQLLHRLRLRLLHLHLRHRLLATLWHSS